MSIIFFRTGIGICIHGDECMFVLDKSLSITPMCPMSLGEGLRLFHALQWVSNMQFDSVDFTLDLKRLQQTTSIITRLMLHNLTMWFHLT